MTGSLYLSGGLWSKSTLEVRYVLQFWYYVAQFPRTDFVECAESPESVRDDTHVGGAMFWGSHLVHFISSILFFPHKTLKFTSTKHPTCRESPASCQLSYSPDTNILVLDSDVYFDIAIDSGYFSLQSPVSLTHV